MRERELGPQYEPTQCGGECGGDTSGRDCQPLDGSQQRAAGLFDGVEGGAERFAYGDEYPFGECGDGAAPCAATGMTRK